MNKNELIKRLINSNIPKNIINAFKKVKREDFILEEFKERSYEDIPLPIGYKQTISQPYTIGFMLSIFEIKNNQKILEIGSGSGYVLALLNEISKNSKLFGIERIKELSDKSKEVLKKYQNIKIIKANGLKGLPEEAPFDRIIVSASTNSIPKNFITQLKEGGILVMPLKNSIIKLKKYKNKQKIKEFPGFAFVPLIEDIV